MCIRDSYDYELNEVFFEDLGIRKPDHFLNAAVHNATTTIGNIISVSYTHLRAHETVLDIVCRLLLEKKTKTKKEKKKKKKQL